MIFGDRFGARLQADFCHNNSHYMMIVDAVTERVLKSNL